MVIVIRELGSLERKMGKGAIVMLMALFSRDLLLMEENKVLG